MTPRHVDKAHCNDIVVVLMTKKKIKITREIEVKKNV
jgi:hypothetical protein